MRKSLAFAVALLLHGNLAMTGTAAFGQEQETADVLRQGIQLIQEGDYAAALEVLEAAAIELEAAAPGDRARSYFYVGVARVFAVGDDEARFAFREAQQHDPQFRPSAGDFPQRVVRLWEEAAAMDVEAESPSGGEMAGTLTVVSVPPGATVYVAGRPQGETPLEVPGLPAGDQRVTLVLDGYINNSRVLALVPNRTERLDVELTPLSEGLSAASGLELQGGSREGSGWWKWAALAGGGGGAAAFLALPGNKPPVAALNISPAGAGMAGLTTWRFDSSGSSDPDDDRLTWSWSFGDGTSGSGAVVTHVYDSPGSFEVTVTVSDGEEQRVTSGRTVVAQNLAGASFDGNRKTISGDNRGLVSMKESARFTQDRETISADLSFDFFDGSGALSATGTARVSGSIESLNDYVCPCGVRLSGPGYSFIGTVNNGANVVDGSFELFVAGLEVTGATTLTRR